MTGKLEYIPDGVIKPHRRTKDVKPKRHSVAVSDFETLVPFANHPFPLYEGQQLADMVESVRANGVLVPIIVRFHPDEKGKYEILSGHNRVVAAKEAGIKEIPAIVMKGLTDDDAQLIVTETNLIQRSFADMKHSERARVLTVHYNALKKNPGYRSDLLADIEELSGAPLGHRMKTRDRLGEQYGIGKTTMARYLRIDKLISELKTQLDEKKIPIQAAEALSFLKTGEQETVGKLLAEGKKITIGQAKELKKRSKNGELDITSINEVLNLGHAAIKANPIKLSRGLCEKYFRPEQSVGEIEDIVSKALEQYFTNGNS